MTKKEFNRSWIRTGCTICSKGFANYFKITKPELLNSRKYALEKCKLYVPSGYIEYFMESARTVFTHELNCGVSEIEQVSEANE